MIQTAQYLLNGLGYDSGTPDGQMGTRTRQAVIRFQRDQSIFQTGVIDQNLLVQLAQETEGRLRKVG